MQELFRLDSLAWFDCYQELILGTDKITVCRSGLEGVVEDAPVHGMEGKSMRPCSMVLAIVVESK